MSTEATNSENSRRKIKAIAKPSRTRILSRLFEALSRSLGRVLLLTLATTMAMTAYVLLRPNTYVAHTEILVDDSMTLSADLNDQSLRRRSDAPSDHLASDVKLIGSALIVEKVMGQIDPAADQDSPLSPKNLLRMLARDKFNSHNDRQGHARRLESFRSHLVITADPSTSVITISYRSKDPDVAANVANGLAQEFLRHRTHNQQQASHQFDRLAESALASLRGKEASSDQGLPPLPSSAQATSPIAQRYTKLLEELTDASLWLADSEARLAEANAALASGAVLKVIAETEISPKTAKLLARDRELRRQIGTLSIRSVGDGIALDRAEAELSDVQEALEEETTRIVEGLRLKVRAVETHFAMLQAKVNDVEAELAHAEDRSNRLGMLEKDDTGLQHVYEAMLEQTKHLNGLAGAPVDKTRIIEPAALPSHPDMASGFLLIGLTVIGTSGLGFVWAVLAELKRKGFNDADEVEAFLGYPVLGLLPNVHGVVPLASKLQLSSREKHWALEGYTFIEGVRGIFNAILPPKVGDSSPTCRVVSITSCFPDEGKTILALSLARQSAAGGVRVLLIEGDMRKVGLATKLSTVSSKDGLVDLLSGRVENVEDIIMKETERGADLLLASGPSDDAFALSRSERMGSLISDLRTLYDLIIIDCPPVLGVSDTLALCEVADETLFVIRWQETRRDVAQSAIRELNPRTIAGVVLTQVDLTRHLKYGPASKYRYQDEFASYALPSQEGSDQART